MDLPLTTRATRLAAGVAAVLCVLAAPRPVCAQILSPGKLAEVHKHLEGLTNCTKCHGGGSAVSEPRCLACHTLVRSRVRAGKGLHGRLNTKQLACQRCHTDHRGRNAKITKWGPGGEKGFDHGRTGWPLTGGHKKVDCNKCHMRRLIVKLDVKQYLVKHPKMRTWLGLTTRCASCHFDEHRGQESINCALCHDTNKWIPAPKFNHDNTAYKLRGKHRRVACVKCHARKKDTTTPANAFPAPVKKTYEVFKPIKHARCLDCHADPHKGKFGLNCEGCHTVNGWNIMKGSVNKRAFHQKTRFPLVGAHLTVSCRACHGPFPGQKAVFRGLPFKRCTDCHADAHEGQTGKLDCDACHTLSSFSPAKFSIDDHAKKTDYPLEGAHAAVACNLCHTPDKRLLRRVSFRIRRKLKRERRPLLVSDMVLTIPKRDRKCLSCHKNPHGHQLDAAIRKHGCVECHVVKDWHDVSRFDHDTESRFPLKGGHAKVTCVKCHFKKVRIAGKLETLYRPLSMQCESCHTDVHLGQFKGTAKSHCVDCHTVKTWKVTKFVHRPPFTRYTLEGAHAKLKCADCHVPVQVDGHKAVRYRPLPVKCEGCHADFHHGAFANLKMPGLKKKSGCAACHTVQSWSDATFDHDPTGFPLKGAHRTTSCWGCHMKDLSAPIPRTCDGCHKDPHAGQLGSQCDTCHDESTWKSKFGPVQHARTGFPLTGRHATIPCQECHFEARDQTFSRVSPSCYGCHIADFQRTGTVSIDHTKAAFSHDCAQCHSTWAWTPAALPGHDTCFLISSGPHDRITCRGCHTSLAGATITGACNTGTYTCIRCHSHNKTRSDEQHKGVAGYQYKDPKCYECHRFAG